MEAPFAVLVADDELHSRQFVRALVEKDPRFQVVEVCNSGQHAATTAQRRELDVMFLDIEMPGMDGFEVVEALGRGRPLIVFVTAYGQYALRAFECAAFDYVTKPISPARFAQVLDRLSVSLGDRRIALTQGADDEARDLVLESTHKGKRVLKAVRQNVIFRDRELQLVESSGNYVNVRVSGETYTVRTSMENFCRDLDPAVFIRVHRSFVVNVNCVRRLRNSKFGSAEIDLADGTVVPVSRGRRDAVSEILRQMSE